MLKAIEIAHAAGREVAFTLSESVCIAGRKEGFAQMIDGGGVDLLFANEDEALQLTGRADLDAALDRTRPPRSRRWSSRAAPRARPRSRGGERISIPAAPVGQGGRHDRRGRPVRGGLPCRARQGRGLERCLWTGAIAAGEVIQHYGARPIADLKALVQL